MGISATELFGKKPDAKASGPGDKKGGGLFGSTSKKGGGAGGLLGGGPNYTEVSTQVNNVSRRLRILEERYVNLRKKTQVTEQNMVTTNKKLQGDVRSAFQEVTELRGNIKKINDQIHAMLAELSDCANRNELQILDKYLSYWEPMEFLTVESARKMIEEFREQNRK